MTYSRRDIGKLTLAAISEGKLLARPNSNFGGVQIGLIVSPVRQDDMPLRADQLLKNILELGVNALELQDVRVEAYAGAPVKVRKLGVQEPKEVFAQAARRMTEWRMAFSSMDKYKALRQMYSDAGVKIYGFRLAILNPGVTDAELEYYFQTARALGADHINTELPEDPGFTARIGALATKYKMMVGYHNHITVNFHTWDTALAQSKYNGINFDVGHYVAGANESPIPFIQKYHDRITCLHLKDRKFGIHGGQNLPWGQGETPLKEVLALMKREKYPFPAGIELEYDYPKSASMAEYRRCLRFCKDALA